MCTVSWVGDQTTKVWPTTYPTVVQPSQPPIVWNINGVSQAEFDKLKAEVENLKKLLKLAKAIDESTGQPDCEMDEKVEIIKRVAELVGVDLEEVFG